MYLQTPSRKARRSMRFTRKRYKPTAAGKKQLDEEWETWKRFSGAVELILRDA
jgi:DNA-binding PadR family transcriptional regulator